MQHLKERKKTSSVARQTGDEETRQSSGVAKKVEDDRGVRRIRSIREGGTRRQKRKQKRQEKTEREVSGLTGYYLGE